MDTELVIRAQQGDEAAQSIVVEEPTSANVPLATVARSTRYSVAGSWLPSLGGACQLSAT